MDSFEEAVPDGKAYYATKRVIKQGGGMCIYLDSAWELEAGALATMYLTSHDGDTDRAICATKKICKAGASKIVYLDAEWGFGIGDWVNLKLIV